MCVDNSRLIAGVLIIIKKGYKTLKYFKKCNKCLSFNYKQSRFQSNLRKRYSDAISKRFNIFSMYILRNITAK